MERAQTQIAAPQPCWILLAGAVATAALSFAVGNGSVAPVIGVVLALVVGFGLSKQPAIRVAKGTVHIDRGPLRAPQRIAYDQVHCLRQENERQVVLVTEAGEVTLPLRAVESADSKTVRKLFAKLVD